MLARRVTPKVLIAAATQEPMTDIPEGRRASSPRYAARKGITQKESR